MLLLRVPKSRGGGADDAAAEPGPRVPMQQAPGVSAPTQVVLPHVHHHCPPDGRRASEQRGVGLKHCSDFPLLGLKVPKVPGVVGVGSAVRIVVSTGGGAALTQVSVLVDVNGFGRGFALRGGVALRAEAAETEQDLQLSLGVDLLEEHLAVDFGQAVRQRCAGSHFAGRVEGGVVLQELRWSHSAAESYGALLTGSQQNQQGLQFI